MIWFCINFGSNIKAKSKIFAPNRHYKLIERKILDIPKFHSKNLKLANFTRLSFISLPLLDFGTIRRCLCSCARLTHTLVSCQNISRMIFSVRRSFVGFRLHSKVLQSPSQDHSILSYRQSDVCAPVCDLGTLGVSCKIFFSYWVATKCIHNLKYGEIVDDFCYIPKSFCSMKEEWGLILGLLFRISEYGPRWNHWDIISLEMDSMTLTPW